MDYDISIDHCFQCRAWLRVSHFPEYTARGVIEKSQVFRSQSVTKNVALSSPDCLETVDF